MPIGQVCHPRDDLYKSHNRPTALRTNQCYATCGPRPSPKRPVESLGNTYY